MGHPIDVAIDSQTRVYASDENNGQILIYSLSEQAAPTPPPESACAGTGGRNTVITGTNSPDTIIGTNGRNTINGLAGNDAMVEMITSMET